METFNPLTTLIVRGLSTTSHPFAAPISELARDAAHGSIKDPIRRRLVVKFLLQTSAG